MVRHKLLKIAAISAVAGAAVSVGATLLVIHHLHKRRARKAKHSQFLTDKMRSAITETIELAGEDVIPVGGVGTSLLQRHLNEISDKRLLALYAAVKVGEYIHESGIDPSQVTRDQLERIKARFTEAQAEEEGDREGMLAKLLSHDSADIKRLLAIALGVLVLA